MLSIIALALGEVLPITVVRIIIQRREEKEGREKIRRVGTGVKEGKEERKRGRRRK